MALGKKKKIMKIHPVRAGLFHADERMDGRTGMTKVIVAFRNIANASKDASDKCGKKSIHILCSITPPPESRAVYEIIWKNIVESSRPHMTI